MAYSCLQDGQRPGYLEHRNGKLKYTVRNKVGQVTGHLWTTLRDLDVIVNMVGSSLTVVRWGQTVPNIVGDDQWNCSVERLLTRQTPRVAHLRETLGGGAITLTTGVVVEDRVQSRWTCYRFNRNTGETRIKFSFTARGMGCWCSRREKTWVNGWMD